MNRRLSIAAILSVAVAAIAAWLWLRPDQAANGNIVVMHGNVDIREVELAFDGSERIVSLAVKEGQRVKAGEILGTLDTVRLRAETDQAIANLEAQEQVLHRLEAGSRAEDIRKVNADVAAAAAELANARLRLTRARELVARQLAAQVQLDDATAAADSAQAQLSALKAQRDLVVAGPRIEDIAAARAQRDAARAALVVARRQLANAELHAPADGIIRNRILEQGDMASPQRPVYTLALVDPVWVRVYVEESDLGRIREGQSAEVRTDSFPDKHYAGWVGFISPTAEFTPKPVETRELRSQLVYQARIYVCNPAGELRLGMPATVNVNVEAAPDAGPDCPGANPEH